MSKITFVLFTYNEEKRIAYAIKNFIKYGEVLIMDGGSTDKTREISESLGAKFYLRPPSDKPQVETVVNFEFIKSKVSTDWIYWGYVDNIAPKKLVEKMLAFSEQDKYKMVLLPLQTFLWGNTKNIVLKSHAPMLFHKDYMDFADNHIHGMGKFLGGPDEFFKMPNKRDCALHHFSTYDVRKFILGHLRYAEEEALGKHARGEKYSTIKMLAATVRYCWIYRRALRGGALGLIILLCYVSFRTMAYAKLYELDNNITLESVENNYSREKEKILKEFE